MVSVADGVELWHESIWVGRVDRVVAEDGVCSGVIQFTLTDAGDPSVRDILRYVAFCVDWNERTRSEEVPPSASEFDVFRPIVKSPKWFTKSAGMIEAIQDAPVFFKDNEVSWRLSPASPLVGPSQLRSGPSRARERMFRESVGVRAAVEVLCRFAEERGRRDADLASFVEGVLVGERGLLTSYHAGLVTPQEVVSALLDRFQIRAFGVPDGPATDNHAAEWAVLRQEISEVLFEARA